MSEASHGEGIKELTDVRAELDEQRNDCDTLKGNLRRQQQENATLRAKIDSLQDKSVIYPPPFHIVKEANLYSAFIEVPYTQGAQVRIM